MKNLINYNNFLKRLLFDAVLLGFIFLSPWWISFVIIIVGFFIFSNFTEGFGAAFILDTLSSPVSWSFHFPFSVFAVILFFLACFVKSRVL